MITAFRAKRHAHVIVTVNINVCSYTKKTYLLRRRGMWYCLVVIHGCFLKTQNTITLNFQLFLSMVIFYCSLLIRFTDDTFDPDIGPTIGKLLLVIVSIQSLTHISK